MELAQRAGIAMSDWSRRPLRAVPTAAQLQRRARRREMDSGGDHVPLSVQFAEHRGVMTPVLRWYKLVVRNVQRAFRHASQLIQDRLRAASQLHTSQIRLRPASRILTGSTRSQVVF
jgi:hypothetical protein